MSRNSLLAYKFSGIALGIAAGTLSGMIFKQVWKLASGENEAPDVLDEDRGWREVLVAAAIQGAIYAVVRTAVNRGSAVGVRHLTGAWPS